MIKSVPVDAVAKSCAAAFLDWITLAVLVLSAIGLLRLTQWSRILTAWVLSFTSLFWIMVCTPMPSEDIHSILEPAFGTPVPVWAYVGSILLGVAILLSPVWFFSRHRESFRRQIW